MNNYRAFTLTDDANCMISYYLTPQRWIDNCIDKTNPIVDEKNWADEIKYLDVDNKNISDEIKNIPNNTGGVYMFFIKGINLPFIEKYIVYVGRCKYTPTQNIRKRAMEYFNDNRPFVKQMFNRWKEYLYYRYFPDTNNDNIDKNEAMLIRAILPPFNEQIPDKIEPRATVSAF